MPTDDPDALTLRDIFDRFDKVIDRFDAMGESASKERQAAAKQCSQDIQALREENARVHAQIREENAKRDLASRRENRWFSLAMLAGILALAGVGVSYQGKLGALNLAPAATTSSTMITTSSTAVAPTEAPPAATDAEPVPAAPSPPTGSHGDANPMHDQPE